MKPQEMSKIDTRQPWELTDEQIAAEVVNADRAWSTTEGMLSRGFVTNQRLWLARAAAAHARTETLKEIGEWLIGWSVDFRERTKDWDKLAKFVGALQAGKRMEVEP